MIILDLQQVMLANLMQSIGNHTNTEIRLPQIREMVLNSIRAINSRFRDEYGEFVIATDGPNGWRRKTFPQYKAARRTSQDASELDWREVFECLRQIKEEIVEYFPYRVIEVKGAEADDVIASLCHRFGRIVGGERLLIVSGDKDFKQLQTYSNVRQYAWIQKHYLDCPNPELFLQEHIIRGDVSDGVPNVMSADDCLVAGVKQTVMTKGRVADLLRRLFADRIDTLDPDLKARFERNSLLIDLSRVPQEIRDETDAQYEAQAGKPRNRIFSYMIKHRLKDLIEAVNDF